MMNGKIFATNINKNLVCLSSYKELLKIENKKNHSPKGKWTKDMNREFTTN